MKVAVVKETTPGERRVALVPDTVAKLRAAGLDVLVESGAGDAAWLSDGSYDEAGAAVVTRAEAWAADVIVMIGKPDPAALARLRPGQALLGTLAPLVDQDLARQLAGAGVTAVSMDMIPRTLPRAQAMDALTSQANIAGYKAVLLAAGSYGRFFPLLITAAGTARPAKVLILGTGVAGLQAIGTARRLGAVVSAYDVRPETKSEVASLGATFVELQSVGAAIGEGGYARALTEDERQAQQEELAAHIARQDVVITTAQVPGRRPPLLVTADALKSMTAGSVVVDMGASELGGNVAGSVPGETVLTENGVTVIGASGLPSTMAPAASAAYARNVSSLLTYMISDGELRIDLSDELQAGVVITHDGRTVHPALSDPAPPAPAGRAAGEPADAAESGPADAPGSTASGPASRIAEPGSAEPGSDVSAEPESDVSAEPGRAKPAAKPARGRSARARPARAKPASAQPAPAESAEGTADVDGTSD